jgi:hypothetical protein
MIQIWILRFLVVLFLLLLLLLLCHVRIRILRSIEMVQCGIIISSIIILRCRREKGIHKVIDRGRKNCRLWGWKGVTP